VAGEFSALGSNLGFALDGEVLAVDLRGLHVDLLW